MRKLTVILAVSLTLPASASALGGAFADYAMRGTRDLAAARHAIHAYDQSNYGGLLPAKNVHARSCRLVRLGAVRCQMHLRALFGNYALVSDWTDNVTLHNDAWRVREIG